MRRRCELNVEGATTDPGYEGFMDTLEACSSQVSSMDGMTTNSPLKIVSSEQPRLSAPGGYHPCAFDFVGEYGLSMHNSEVAKVTNDDYKRSKRASYTNSMGSSSTGPLHPYQGCSRWIYTLPERREEIATVDNHMVFGKRHPHIFQKILQMYACWTAKWK